jgi:DNA-binding transcriptional MerR regulator
MHFEALKVGELAKRTGLTVRALHHYDEIGLVKPSLHTESGHRLYTAPEIVRLQQVLSLRELGFSLDEARNCLNRSDFSPLAVVRMHLARLRERIECHRKLCERLESLAAQFGAAVEVSADEFLQTIEVMTMVARYFTPQQLELIEASREQVGDELLAKKQEEWAELIALVRAEKDKGTPLEAAKVRALAKRWIELVSWTTGGDPEIEKSLERLWRAQGDQLAAQHGEKYDPRPVMDYMAAAIAASKNSE